MSATPDPSPLHATPLLPSGTVTFAFTDIEGSTIRWERSREAMQAALRAHDALVREAIATHRGHVFKTLGDGFCAAFSRPQDALAAMLAAQQALAAQDFSAVGGLAMRAAIHTGTADEREDDYFGPAVNRIARLLAIGHGGQILISGATAEIVQSALPAQMSLRDLGPHRLKDLARPERVYQLLAPGLGTQFPALRSLGTLPNNLPLQLSSFIGRESEVAAITALLHAHRLVTIVGAGGVGKTRTSLQVGANLLDGSGDGVWFIELAPLSSGEYIARAVAQAMDLTLGGESDSLGQLAAALRTKRALLIFDNCEHLVAPAARVIAAILRSCPEIRVLSTTRQSLGISGEATYRMPSLTIPEHVEGLTASEAARFPAIALFVERALAIDQRFALGDHNAAIIADICRRLDGIPLAIELAAARIRILSPPALRERLDQRFRVLTGGRRDLLPRQQTLRALIDWSYDLLDERERALFRRLSIFVNGFTLEGALALGEPAELDEVDVLDVLASLVDKSLVLSEPAGDTARYRLLESTRAYALEKLTEQGELSGARARHLRFLHDLFVAVRARWERSGSSAEMEAQLLAELEDVRAALDGLDAAGGRGIELGAELLVAIGSLWDHVGLGSEGSARLKRAIALLPGDRVRLASHLWDTFSGIAWTHYHAEAALEGSSQAVRLARESDDPQTLAGALTIYARSLARAGAFEEAAMALAEADQVLPAESVLVRRRILEARAFVASFSGDLDGAAQAYERLRENVILLGDQPGANIFAISLAEIEHRRGHTENAAKILGGILPSMRTNRDRSMLLSALANLCSYLVALDRLSEVRAIVQETFEIASEHDLGGVLVTCLLEGAALAVALEGDVRRGAVLAGYTGAVFTRMGIGREDTERQTRMRLDALLAERLAPSESTSLLAKGAALAPHDAIALALEDSASLR